MQRQIDDGLQWCSHCDRVGWHTFCGQCGRRFYGADLTWRDCPKCKAKVSTAFCALCGAPVYDEILRKWEAGEIDLAAESAKAACILREQFGHQRKAETARAKPPTLGAALAEVFGSKPNG